MDKSPPITKSLYNRKRLKVATSPVSSDKLFLGNTDQTKNENTSSKVRALTAYGVAKAGTSDEAAERANRVAYVAGRHSLHYRHQEAMDERLEQRIAAALSELSVLEHQWKTNREALQAVSLAMLRQWQPQLAMLARSACFHAYLHMDLDAFFAFAEERRAPQYRTVPMAVGSSAVLCTSNYLARPFGVRSAMPGFIARRLCPQLTIVPVDFAYYGALSTVVRGVLADYDSDFTTMSLDEATVDLAAYVAMAYPPCTHVHTHTPDPAQPVQAVCSSDTVEQSLLAAPSTAPHAAPFASDHVSGPLSSLPPAGSPIPAAMCGGAPDLLAASAPAPLLEVFLALGHGVAVHALPAADTRATTPADSVLPVTSSADAASAAAPAGDPSSSPLPPVEDGALRRLAAEHSQLLQSLRATSVLAEAPLAGTVDGAARRLDQADMWTCVQSGEVAMRVPSDELCSEAIRARFHACAACLAADEVRARLWRSVGVARDLRLSRLAHAVLAPHDNKSGAATPTTTTPVAPAPRGSTSFPPDAPPDADTTTASRTTEDADACPCAACAWRIPRYDETGALSLPHTPKDDLVLDGSAQVRVPPPPTHHCRAPLPRMPAHEAVFAAGRPRSVEHWQALLAGVARELRGRVHWHSGLTCSVGVACSRSLAKVCSDLNKPDGQCLVRPSAAATLAFLHSLPARKIPGVGRVSEKLLTALGVSTVGALLAPRALMRVKHVLGGTQYQWLLAAAAGGPDTVEVSRLLMPASTLGQAAGKSKSHFMAHSAPTPALTHMDAEAKVEDHSCTAAASPAPSGASVSGLETMPVKNSHNEVMRCADAASEHTYALIGVHTPTSSVLALGRGHSCTNTCARVWAADRDTAACSNEPVCAPTSARSRSRHTTHAAHMATLRIDALCKAPCESEGEDSEYTHSVAQRAAANSLKCEPRESEIAQRSFLAPCEGECVCVALPTSIALHVRALCGNDVSVCTPACPHSNTATTCDQATLGSTGTDAPASEATTAAVNAGMSTSCVCVHQLDMSLNSLCVLSRALCHRHMRRVREREQQRQRAAMASPIAPMPMTYHGAYDPPPAAPAARSADNQGADADAEEPEDLMHLFEELLADQQITPAVCADTPVSANGHTDSGTADTAQTASPPSPPDAASLLVHAAALLPLWDAWSTRIGGGERADTSSSRKSVSCVRTFAGTDELSAIVSVLRRVWTRFCADVEELGVRGRCVGVTLKYTTYETRQRSETRRESTGAGVEGWQERLWQLALRLVLSEVGVPRDGQRAQERELARNEGGRSKRGWEEAEVDLSEYEGRVRKACRLVGLRMSMLEGEEEDSRAGGKRQRGGLLQFAVEASGGDLWRGQSDADSDGRVRKRARVSVHERVASLWGDAGKQADDGALLAETGSESEAKAETGGGRRVERHRRAGAPAATTASADVGDDADADCVLVDAGEATYAATMANVSPGSDAPVSIMDRCMAEGVVDLTASASATHVAVAHPSPPHAQGHARSSVSARSVRVRWRRERSGLLSRYVVTRAGSKA